MADGAGGYNIGASFANSPSSGSSANSPFNVTGGGGGLQIFGAASRVNGVPQTPSNPKTGLYVAIAVGLIAFVGLIWILRR